MIGKIAAGIQYKYATVNPKDQSEIWNRNFCVDIVNHEHLITISNVGTYKFKYKCLIPQLKLSLQGMTMTKY